jgi:hypothetical protein
VGELAHVHVGPGCLGLGLVVATTLEAGMDVHLIGRPGCRLRKEQLRVSFHGDHGQRHAAMPLAVRTISAADSFSRLEGEAQDAIRTAPNLLLTTSTGAHGMRAGSDVLLDIISQRPKRRGFRTLCVSAEGSLGESWRKLRRQMEADSVDCRDSMVSRLCYPSPESLGPEAMEVYAEGFAEWVIEGPIDQPLLAALDRVGHVEFTEEKVPEHCARRHWLVDSGQLALTLMARRAGVANTRVGEYEEWLRRFCQPVVSAYIAREDALPGTRDYVQDHINAWTRHDHDLQGALRSLQRADLIPFLEEVETKLVEPLEAVAAQGQEWTEGIEAFNSLQAVLSDFNQYADSSTLDVAHTPLAEVGDEKALKRYDKIVHRVFDPETAARMTEDLRKELRVSRARYAQAGST